MSQVTQARTYPKGKFQRQRFPRHPKALLWKQQVQLPTRLKARRQPTRRALCHIQAKRCRKPPSAITHCSTSCRKIFCFRGTATTEHSRASHSQEVLRDPSGHVCRPMRRMFVRGSSRVFQQGPHHGAESQQCYFLTSYGKNSRRRLQRRGPTKRTRMRRWIQHGPGPTKTSQWKRVTGLICRPYRQPRTRMWKNLSEGKQHSIYNLHCKNRHNQMLRLRRKEGKRGKVIRTRQRTKQKRQANSRAAHQGREGAQAWGLGLYLEMEGGRRSGQP